MTGNVSMNSPEALAALDRLKSEMTPAELVETEQVRGDLILVAGRSRANLVGLCMAATELSLEAEQPME